SGSCLKKEYEKYDAGSFGLVKDEKYDELCCCDKILTGRMDPCECPLFGKKCTPLSPRGACMVSSEGNCFSEYGRADV
ncbi:MAG: hydrogenase formation protein HypD, partial [Lachnospiraceae bacterium]|nr:hydrogenase formation protein HypD [Lachnospiraceae bacterium]